MSSVSNDAIPEPVDGTPVPDGFADKNVAAGIQVARFVNLVPSTMYYFKIFAYVGSGISINYKTDETIPRVQIATQP
jgi:hypothetical protein